MANGRFSAYNPSSCTFEWTNLAIAPQFLRSTTRWELHPKHCLNKITQRFSLHGTKKHKRDFVFIRKKNDLRAKNTKFNASPPVPCLCDLRNYHLVSPYV